MHSCSRSLPNVMQHAHRCWTINTLCQLHWWQIVAERNHLQDHVKGRVCYRRPIDVGRTIANRSFQRSQHPKKRHSQAKASTQEPPARTRHFHSVKRPSQSLVQCYQPTALQHRLHEPIESISNTRPTTVFDRALVAVKSVHWTPRAVVSPFSSNRRVTSALPFPWRENAASHTPSPPLSIPPPSTSSTPRHATCETTCGRTGLSVAVPSSRVALFFPF